MKYTRIYELKHVVAACIMLLALAWLTVSLPYVYSFQQEIAKHQSASSPSDCPIDSEESNIFGNSTEEKAPTTPTEEYLHHADDHHYLLNFRLSPDHRHSYDIYVAYHGEVQCPPPDFIS